MEHVAIYKEFSYMLFYLIKQVLLLRDLKESILHIEGNIQKFSRFARLFLVPGLFIQAPSFIHSIHIYYAPTVSSGYHIRHWEYKLK